MRRRPSRLARVAATIIVAVPVVAGCAAKVHGTPPERAAPHNGVVVPHGTMAPLPEAPPDVPADEEWSFGARYPSYALNPEPSFENVAVVGDTDVGGGDGYTPVPPAPPGGLYVPYGLGRLG